MDIFRLKPEKICEVATLANFLSSFYGSNLCSGERKNDTLLNRNVLVKCPNRNENGERKMTLYQIKISW